MAKKRTKCLESFDKSTKLVYLYTMNKIKELNAKIGELASAMEIMNAKATPATAMTVKVANEVFGKKLADMQKQLTELKSNA